MMDRFTRRDAFKMGTGAALGAATLVDAAPAHSAVPIVNVPAPKQPIEAGATIRVIRPSKFVEADEAVWNENQARFIKATGVQVRTDYGAPGYGGPCPPEGDHPHRYVFTVHAVGVDALPVGADTSAAVVGFQLHFNTLEKATLMGLYKR